MARRAAKKQKRERASARRRAEEHTSGFDRTAYRVPDGMSMWQPKSGKRVFDVVEFEAGAGNPYAEQGQYYYERTFFIHRDVGAEGNSYVCPARTAGKSCPICERWKSEQRKSDADDDLVKALKPKERQLFLIYDHAEKDRGLQLYDVAHWNFGKRLDAEIKDSDEEDGYDLFASVDSGEGMTLRAGFVDDSFGGQSFVKCETIHFKPRKQDLPDEILEQVVCLDDLLIVHDYDKLKAIFLQEDANGDEDDEEEEKPKRRGSRKKQDDYEEEIDDDGDPKDLDEDDDEPWDSEDEEDDEEEEEEEEEKPKPRSRRGKKKEPVQEEKEDEEDDEEDDEDWEDDWDDDEEEEEKPKPKSKRGRRR